MTLCLSLLFIIPILLLSCEHVGSEREARDDVDSFATAYYNWQFQKAVKYCTRTSEPWLHFAATNVHQADIDILRTQDEGASHEIKDFKIIDDTTAQAFIEVHNYLRMDTIGKAGDMMKKGMFIIKMRYNNKKWLVDLNQLPREVVRTSVK